MLDKCLQLKQLIDAPEILVMPGVYDGFSARVLEMSGFKSGIISGAGVSESRLGRPDIGLLGLEPNLDTARQLSACTTVPLLADIDTGYGNALNVYYAVKAFEEAGVAGVAIEDQVWPKRCGHMEGKDVVSREEMLEKVHAAVEARTNPNFVIKARTDAAGVLGVDEAIERLNLYTEAGADHLVADALLTEEDIARVASSVSKPLAINMGLGIRFRPTTPLLPLGRLQELGVAVVTYPRVLSTSAVRGMLNGMQALKESIERNDVEDRPDLAVDFDELSGLMNLKGLRDMEQRFKSD